MKALAACIAVIALAMPAAAVSGAYDSRVIVREHAAPDNPPEFEKSDRIVDIDESPRLDFGRIFGPGTAPAGGGLEYISSCLWSDLYDFHLEDNIMYCALTYGLMIMDVSGGPPFDIISTLYLPTTYGRGDQLEKHGNYIYFTRASEVVVIDVSDAHAPFVVGSHPSQGEFIELTCADDVLYLVDKETGPGYYTYYLTILDVSDPSSPAMLIRSANFGEYVRHVAALHDIAFVSACSEFHILDVSEPTNPVVLASRDLSCVSRAVLRDSLAFAFTYGPTYSNADSVFIYNLSDPTNPVRIGAHESSDRKCNSNEMLLVDSLLITPCDIINVGDPSSPTLISPYAAICHGTALGLRGTILYRSLTYLIQSFDIANINDPHPAEIHELPGMVHDVYVRGNLAYVAAGDKGLVILDISNIQRPVVIGGIDDMYSWRCIDVQNEILCDGTHVVDISDPAIPVVLSILGLGRKVNLDIRLHGNLAFVAQQDAGLLVFDLTDPSDPMLLSSYEVEFSSNAAIALKDSLAFLAGSHYNTAVHIIDYSNPSAPELIGTYGDKSSMVVAVDGNIMYTELNNALHVVDISDAYNPAVLATYGFRLWSPRAMVKQGDILYTTDDAYGNTVIFDVSDPHNPLYVENFKTPSSSAHNLFIVDDTVFLADTYALMILHTPYNAPPARSVCFDIKPGSCPNPLNWKINPNGKAVLPVAILGSEELDVHDIDVSSVRLLGDLEPVRYAYEDVAAPPDSADGECICLEEDADGYLDLTLKFDKRSVLEKLHALPEADRYVVTITGFLSSGESIEGYDCVHPVGREAGGSDESGPVADGSSDKTRPLVDAAAEGVTIRGNYPNPFNPATEISFSLPEASRVTLDIFNIAGQRVVTLADDYFATGDHTLTWNGRDASGQRVASGVYFCRIRTGATTVTKKMLLLK